MAVIIFASDSAKLFGGISMSTTVCKFGGSSLSDACMFRRVLDIVRSGTARRYIVLSAPGKRNSNDEKITDLLYRAHYASRADSRYIFSQIRERYTQIRDALCPSYNLEDELDAIYENLHISPDFAASRGEFLAAKLFSAFSGIPFVDANHLIRFYPDKTLDMQSSCESIRSRLSMLPFAVIPGFYGSLPDGSICTFTRGGSDVSGAIIAAAINADLYENWTDVDGLFTADPNLIPNAERNPCVSLDQMQQIALAGAKLLHPDSLSILRGTGIDTLIKNTFAPDALGTRISENCRTTVKCITGRKNLSSPLLRGFSGQCPHIQLEENQNYCVISAFGLDSTAMRMIHRRLKHVCIIHMQDHFKLIMRNEMYESAVRTIHAMLNI